MSAPAKKAAKKRPAATKQGKVRVPSAAELAAFDDDSDRADRLSERRVLPEAKAEETAAPSMDESQAEWGRAPTVKDQRLRYPDSVKIGKRTTEQLNFSNPEDLARWNEIQAMEHPDTAPTGVILEVLNQPTGTSWVYLVTHAPIHYQKL